MEKNHKQTADKNPQLYKLCWQSLSVYKLDLYSVIFKFLSFSVA